MEETNNRVAYCEVCYKTVTHGTAICPDCSEVVETLVSIGICTENSIQALRAIHQSEWLIKTARRKSMVRHTEKLQSFGTRYGSWGSGYSTEERINLRKDSHLNFLLQAASAEEFAREYMQYPVEPIEIAIPNQVGMALDEFTKHCNELSRAINLNFKERVIVIGKIGGELRTAAQELTGGIGLSNDPIIHEKVREMAITSFIDKETEVNMPLEPYIHKKDERKYLPKFNNHKNKKKK